MTKSFTSLEVIAAALQHAVRCPTGATMDISDEHIILNARVLEVYWEVMSRLDAQREG